VAFLSCSTHTISLPSRLFRLPPALILEAQTVQVRTSAGPVVCTSAWLPWPNVYALSSFWFCSFMPSLRPLPFPLPISYLCPTLLLGTNFAAEIYLVIPCSHGFSSVIAKSACLSRIPLHPPPPPHICLHGLVRSEARGQLSPRRNLYFTTQVLRHGTRTSGGRLRHSDVLCM
jgi:hypothetical protein